MATEKEADRAREEHAGSLQKLGAHGISVEPISRTGRRGQAFAVVAFFDQKPKNLPKTLRIASRSKSLEVPLLVRIVERFRAE